MTRKMMREYSTNKKGKEILREFIRITGYNWLLGLVLFLLGEVFLYFMVSIPIIFTVMSVFLQVSILKYFFVEPYVTGGKKYSRQVVRKIWIIGDKITLLCIPWRFRPIVQYQAERYMLTRGDFPVELDFKGIDAFRMFSKKKWKSRLLIKQYDPKDKKYREVEIIEDFFDNWEELLTEMGLEIIEVGNKKVVQHRK